jgi:hypothetical protein
LGDPCVVSHFAHFDIDIHPAHCQWHVSLSSISTPPLSLSPVNLYLPICPSSMLHLYLYRCSDPVR